MFVRISESSKTKAFELRRKGLSYSEILKEIPVAKSTLSLWLRSVGLSKRQKQRLTEKKLSAMRRGADTKRQQRLDAIEQTYKETKKDIKLLTKKDLWLAGIMLYWAEGSKQKKGNVSQGALFSNSDPLTIQLYVKWLKEILGIINEDIMVELYIHETGNVNRALQYWSKILSCDKSRFKVYFKKNKIRTNRQNTSGSYYGLIRIGVRRSSMLNRKIFAWIGHITKYWGIV